MFFKLTDSFIKVWKRNNRTKEESVSTGAGKTEERNRYLLSWHAATWWKGIGFREQATVPICERRHAGVLTSSNEKKRRVKERKGEKGKEKKEGKWRVGTYFGFCVLEFRKMGRITHAAWWQFCKWLGHGLDGLRSITGLWFHLASGVTHDWL